MKTSSLQRCWRHGVFSAIAIMSVVATIGCSTTAGGGSTADNHGTDLSAAQSECVKAAEAFIDTRGGDLPSTLPSELTPLTKPPTPGLTLTTLTLGADPTSTEGADDIVEAATAVGWDARKVSHNGSVEDLNSKAIQAIESSDVVNIVGYPPAAVQPAIAAAKKNNVVLLLASVADAPESVPGYASNPVGGTFWSSLGELAGYEWLRNSGCQGRAVTFSLPFEAVLSVGDTFKKTVEAQCDDCTVETVELNGTDVGTPAMTNTIVSKLQADPDVTFAFFTSGSITSGVQPALAQAGVDVGIGGAIPVAENLQALQQGRNSFWLGTPLGPIGWTVVDSALRVLDSMRPWNSSYFAATILTSENLDSAAADPAYPQDYQRQFLDLWLVK